MRTTAGMPTRRFFISYARLPMPMAVRLNCVAVFGFCPRPCHFSLCAVPDCRTRWSCARKEHRPKGAPLPTHALVAAIHCLALGVVQRVVPCVADYVVACVVACVVASEPLKQTMPATWLWLSVPTWMRLQRCSRLHHETRTAIHGARRCKSPRSMQHGQTR